MTQLESRRLFGKEFILLNGIFFLASVAMAVFFKFYQYLHSLGIPPAWFGFIIASDSLAGLFLQPFLSPFLNPGNARKWMAAGIAVMIGALFSYHLAATVPGLIVVRIFQGGGFVCLIAAMITLMVSYIPPQKSGQAFGFVSTVRLVPYAIVPPLVSSLAETPQDFRVVLRYMIGIMLFSMALLFFLKPEGTLPDGASPEQRIRSKELFENLRNRKVFILLLANLFLYSGYTTVFFFLGGYGRKIGIVNPGIFFTIATLVMIGVRLFGGSLFDKTDKVLLTVLFMIDLVLCYAFLPFVGGHGFFYGLAFLTGLGWGIVMPVLNALMFDVSPLRFRGLNLNLSLVMMQGGFFIGPFLGGLVLGTGGYGALFIFCSGLSLLAAVLIPFVKEERIPGAVERIGRNNDGE